MSESFGAQVRVLARRSVVRTVRQPAVIIPPLVFPLFLLSVNATGLASATDIPGFPTDNYLSFALAAIFVQAAMSGVQVAGGAITEDVRTGFLSRLSLTRMRSAAMVAAQLAGVILLGTVQAALFLGVGLIAGATVEAGVGGAIVLLALAILITTAFGALGVLAALGSGSGPGVQAIFPVMFALFFLSSMAMPRDLIKEDWFRTIATANPVSYLIEAPRSLLITGWDAEALALGGGIALFVLLLALVLFPAQLKRRMVRA